MSDCTEYCRSSQHGDIITAAITKRGVSDVDLCAFLMRTCCRCESVVDSAGRNALHMAASCGRTELIKWLVYNRKADINAKDRESAYTALHRSIFYGKIHAAVELMRLGASLGQSDLNGLTALEHAMKDSLKPSSLDGELYSWGSNTNNLFGGHQSRNNPNLVDAFHRTYPHEYAQHICIDQFHTVIVSKTGKVYSCGHGRGGRLGLGNESSAPVPLLVEFPGDKSKESVKCIQASISRDHSIFLSSEGTIYTCGLNKYRILGHNPPPEKLLVPRPINLVIKDIQGVMACQYHSLAWGSDAMYVWGLNVGQLGKKAFIGNEDFIVTPKVLNILPEMSLLLVATSNGATAFYTKKGDIYLLHDFKCKKIVSKLLNVTQISVIGGKVDSPLVQNEIFTEAENELKVTALTSTGNVLLWQENDQQLCRCIYSVNRAIIVKHLCLNSSNLLLVTEEGEIFKGIIKQRKKKIAENVNKSNEKTPFHKFLEKDECIMMILNKMPKIHRAVYVQSDPKGKDYCVIQALPFKYNLPDNEDESQIKSDLHFLLKNSDPMDDVHDVIIKLGRTQFAAHKFILLSRCSYFTKVLIDEKKDVVEIDDIVPVIFEQLLEFLYIGSCDLLKCGELKNESLRMLCIDEESAKVSDKNGGSLKDPIRMLRQAAKKMECRTLKDHLNALYMDRFVIKSKNDDVDLCDKISFDRSSFPELCNVRIKCNGNEILHAHKCILSSRLDYFSNMFSVRWQENQNPEVNIPVSKTVIEILLKYLYTDSLSQLENVEIDHLFKTIILADQYFVVKLKMKCEVLLSKILTLKNAVQILSFSHIYNAETLKSCCKKFITLNILPFLELGYLNELEDELLEELSNFYCEDKKEMWSRVITPYSVAVPDEEISSISETLSTSELEEVTQKLAQKKKSRSRRGHNTSISEPEESVVIEENKLRHYTSKQMDIASGLNNFSFEGESLNSYRHLATSPNKDVSFDYSADFPNLSSSFNEKQRSNTYQMRFRKVRPPPREKIPSVTSDSCASSPDTKISPWKTLNNEQFSPSEMFSMDTIISEEKQQKQNLIKLNNKLLAFTQMEDQAIDELAKFYNVQEIEDELIVIERVQVPSANSSLWVSTSK